MAEKKQKKKESAPEKNKNKKNKQSFLSTTPTLSKTSKKMKKAAKKEERKQRRSSGPRLPSALRKELDLLDSKPKSLQESDGEEDAGGDNVYEYEEQVAEEETRKNRRFDEVENYEYELPEGFEDENVPSDDEEVDEDVPSDESDEGENGNRHLRMLEGITGLPGVAFQGKPNKGVVVSDFQGDATDGPISIQDLLDPLHGKPGYSQLRKRLHELERKPMTIQAPLPKVQREKLERKVAYEHSKKDITKWEPLVKRNREAPTLYFNEDMDLGYSTVGAIAAGFEPRTELEKKMAALVHDPEVMEAHHKDGAKLLELNKISFEEVRDRHNRLAKMRSLLFRHEMKAKHIKKIKSKTFHRVLKREKLKAAAAEVQMDPETAKENAIKQEFKRAEERMTLKHKNRSKWAKRILERGLSVQDEGTQAAFAEQLHQHELLTRKMNSMHETSSSNESSDDDDDLELSPGTAKERSSKLLNRAKEKTIKAINKEDELPKSGVFALPFMERGMKKRQEAAEEEARIALQEYDASLRQFESEDDIENVTLSKVSGRKTFGPPGKKTQESNKRQDLYNADGNSDSDGDFEAPGDVDVEPEVNNSSQEVLLKSALHDESESGRHAVFKAFDDIVKEPGPKTTYEVAIFASDSWKKMKAEDISNDNSKKADSSQIPKDMDQNSDVDSEEMVDGFLSHDTKTDYELPSQAELISRAFAGDDVEAEFEKDKMEVLNDENPEPEKPVLLPGWGQWTDVQQKKGLPSWMLKEHETAKRKREESLKKRKDAHLKHVIILEKVDKKAEKLLANTLPYPYTSKEVYEQSIRMPLGPDYNPAISVGALNRPAVVKKAGIIIKPIQYQDVDPHEKPEEPKYIVHKIDKKPKAKKAKTSRRKPI